MKNKLSVLLTLVLCSVSTHLWANENALTLEDCHLDGITSQVRCGTLVVPSNYKKPNGETLSVNFAILPAIDNSANKEPLMFLAGGPGQAAVELAGHIRSRYREIRKTRDIILVDQRGTGQSNPLQCEDSLKGKMYSIVPEDFNEKEVQTCLDALQKDNDLSVFSSENAVRDFDEVRKALGHQQVNLYGGSYGTRAALVYMRMFPNAIKSVVLDSVGPVEVPIGLFGLSSARSFDLLISNCKAEEGCKKAYPDLRAEYDAVVERLAQSTIGLQVAHPRLGTQTEFNLSKGKFISTLFTALYSTQTRNLVPLIIHEAFNKNYQPLLGLISTNDGAMNMYIGLHFNIVCSEDMPKISPKMLSADKNNTFGKDQAHQGWKIACPLWPKYEVDESFYEPVIANIPTLVLSGDLDPVTPPSNGEKSAATLPNNHHIVSKNSAHIVATTHCGVSIVNEFLETLSPKSLDESCLADMPNESFMTSLNGSI